MCSEYPNRWFRYFVATWAFLETFLLAGYKAGWASLVYVLKKEGIYRSLCHGSSQRYKYMPIHANMTYRRYFGVVDNTTYGQYGNFTLEGTKILQDEDTGCADQDAMFELCVSISNTPWLMFIGYMALGNGGMGILQTNNQVSYMFAKGGPTVIGLICGAFDASAAVMLGVKLAYDHGVSLQMSFIVIGCLNMLVVISTFSFLPKKFIKNTQTDSTTGADHEAVLSEESKHASAKDNNGRQMSERTILLSGALHELRSGVSEPHTGTDTIPTDEERNRVSMNGEEPRMKEDKETSRNSRLLGQLLDRLHVLSHAGIAGSVHTIRWHGGLPLLHAARYPSDYFAALYGVMFMISGFASFLQYPLFLWCQSSPSGYRQVYSMLGLTCIMILVQPIYLVYTGRREKQ
ncbi:uncharacterized protein [Haliotis cracherodii]|uniref:uncharacterized protein n=1 Tax=Haliotis cracherodii TaxID=6455 RepID=UPI0039E888D3